MLKVTRKSLSDVIDQVGPDQMGVNGEVGQCGAENIEDEPGGGLAISELVAAVVGDDAHQVLAHCQLNGLLLARVHLHPEGHEIKHGLVLENGRCLENRLVFQLCWILQHLEHDLPRLMLLGELDKFLVGQLK